MKLASDIQGPQARRRGEAGFTLIELLTIIGIIGVLSMLGLSSFKVYRADAAYSVAESTLRNARSAVEASVNNVDNPPPAVGLTVQTAPGAIADSNARAYLPAMQIPKNVKFQVSYDPTCTSAACQSELIEVSHCYSDEYTRWIRFGDGLDVTLDHVSGGGCS
ncbi:MAG: type II secretion system protein [Deltaproteobacteria bacterium]|nr:type II secretion system protein [Deltaproteobacteria bacterium]